MFNMILLPTKLSSFQHGLQQQMKSERSLSSLQYQTSVKRTPIITFKRTDQLERPQKSTGVSQCSSKKMKLRDYLYLNQITDKKRSLQKPNALNHSQTGLSQTFNPNSGKSLQKGASLRHNRRKIEKQEVFEEVRKEIDTDLSEVIDTALKLKNCLSGISKSNINQSLMIQLYEIRHKTKYNILQQLKKSQQIISAFCKTMELVVPTETKIHTVQSINSISKVQSELKEQRKANEEHKVCMMRRRETIRRS